MTDRWRPRIHAALGGEAILEAADGTLRIEAGGLEAQRRAVEILAESRQRFVPAGRASSCGPREVEVSAPRGVFELWPDELVVRAGAGTSIAQLDAVLAPEGLELGLATASPRDCAIGALFAAGDRGLRGAVGEGLRERTLALTLVDGTGTVRRSGAAVVKNVAGFDLTRIHHGARGSLGLVLDLTLRVRARPRAVAVAALACTLEELIPTLRRTRAVAQDNGAELWIGSSTAATVSLDPTPHLVLLRESSPEGLESWARTIGTGLQDVDLLRRIGAACWDDAAPVLRVTGATLRRISSAVVPAGRIVVDLLSAEVWWTGSGPVAARAEELGRWGEVVWAENHAARAGAQFSADRVRRRTERRLRSVFDPFGLLPAAPAPLRLRAREASS